MEKVSYERRVYESVEGRSLSWVISKKSTENKNSFRKGYDNKKEMTVLVMSSKVVICVTLMHMMP